jgi:hypothetical protein
MARVGWSPVQACRKDIYLTVNNGPQRRSVIVETIRGVEYGEVAIASRDMEDQTVMPQESCTQS